MIVRLKKMLHRLGSVITGNVGIYGKHGVGNKAKWGAIIDEASSIGNYNYFGRGTTVSTAKIGNYCSVGEYVSIGPGEHFLGDVSTCDSLMEEVGCGMDLTKDDVCIGNDVWIGTHAVVLRGVTISNGAVIAAGAVVTKNVGKYEIWGGVPAHFIKYRIPEKKINIITESRWYEEKNRELTVKIVKDLRKKME